MFQAINVNSQVPKQARQQMIGLPSVHLEPSGKSFRGYESSDAIIPMLHLTCWGSKRWFQSPGTNYSMFVLENSSYTFCKQNVPEHNAHTHMHVIVIHNLLWPHTVQGSRLHPSTEFTWNKEANTLMTSALNKWVYWISVALWAAAHIRTFQL